MSTEPGFQTSPPTDIDAELAGRTLGDFQLLRRLGQGGMGQVYLGEQLSLRRKVAVKLLRPDLACNGTALVRFRNEAEAVARMTHPNIVGVYAVGEHEGHHYMALEFVDGFNLKEYLTQHGPTDVPLALSIMRQVTAALQRAAESGLIHRDIKPENILLTRKGQVKVADFGLSRCFQDNAQTLNLTQSGVAMGTPLYMSPEQVQGYPLDPRTDIYSFGVTCYHMLTGKPPFQGQTAFDVAVQHVQTPPRPLREVRPELPAELCAVVERMMAKKPEERYPSARELYQDISRLRASLGKTGAGASRPMLAAASVGSSWKPWRWRRRWQVATTVGIALVGGAATGWLTRPSAPAQATVQPVRAESPAERREKVLLETIHLYDNPADNHETLLGLDHRLELGILYLDQHRLMEAKSFFDTLANGSTTVLAYRLLGQMGQGIVAAEQDRAADSVRIFTALFTGKHPIGVRRWEIIIANRAPRFRRFLAEAMQRNVANKATCPRELRALLEIGPVRWPAAKAGDRRVSRRGT